MNRVTDLKNARSVLSEQRRAVERRRPRSRVEPDYLLLLVAGSMLMVGLVWVASASVSISEQTWAEPFHFFRRQLLFVAAGVGLGALVLRVPVSVWNRLSAPMLFAALFLLVLVLIPGIGREINGSMRWLFVGGLGIQVSELAKLLVIVYLAGYIQRHDEVVRSSVAGFLRPMALLSLFAVLLLLEPDFGATVIMMAVALVMMFLAGARLVQFFVLVLLMALAFAALAIISPYRMQRITAFLDPWADPFNSGFQLSQALIAFGRGEWTGVGLGSSIQKLSYLPEAHTDFIFAVFAEESGFIGVASLIVLFAVFVWRAFRIGRLAEKSGNVFSAWLAYGIGAWVALQGFVNMGVNMGVLPTKGLTLPLISYGGSSMLVSFFALALLLRIDLETRFPFRFDGRERRQP